MWLGIGQFWLVTPMCGDATNHQFLVLKGKEFILEMQGHLFLASL